MACLQHLILLLFFSQCNAKSVQQCFRPLPGPEIKHDFYSCSVVMDWSRYATEDCERALGYQVQYINGCTSDYVSLDYTPNETFIFPNKIPGDCSVDTNCYARVRAKFGEAVWSRYSAWTTLSTAYEEVKTCVSRGTDFCLPIFTSCSGGTLPEFIINDELYLFQEIYVSSSHFNVTYDGRTREYSVCFLNIMKDIYFIEFCLSHSVCTSFSPSVDGELMLVKRLEIEVSTAPCTPCNDHHSQTVLPEIFGLLGVNSTSSSYTQNKYCVVVDLYDVTILSWLNYSLCVSITSPNVIHLNTKIYLLLTATNKGQQGTNSSVLMDANKREFCQEYSEDRVFEVSIIEADQGSIVYLPRPCINISIKNTPSTAGSNETPSNSTVRVLPYTMLSLICLFMSFVGDDNELIYD